MKRLKSLLEQELARTGSSRSELARRLDIPAASLFNYLYSDIEPSTKTLRKIAAYFRKPLSYFDDQVQDEKTSVPENAPPDVPTDPRNLMHNPQAVQELQELINIVMEVAQCRHPEIKKTLHMALIRFRDQCRDWESLQIARRELAELKSKNDDRYREGDPETPEERAKIDALRDVHK